MAAGTIALFGGSFNPIHHGHLIVARAVAESLDIPRLVFVPSANPPHKQGDGLADARDRLAMVRAAIEDEPGFAVSDFEIGREGPSYTILTVEAYRRDLPAGATLYWMIGGDTLPELHTWHRAAELVDLCRIVTAVRPGFEKPNLDVLRPVFSDAQINTLEENILATPRIDISATQIRDRVTRGLSIRYLVPEAVAAYIESQGLYREERGCESADLRCGG